MATTSDIDRVFDAAKLILKMECTSVTLQTLSRHLVFDEIRDLKLTKEICETVVKMECTSVT